MQLLSYYQCNSFGCPQYQYCKVGDKFQASLTLPNGEVVFSPLSDNKEEASERVASEALKRLSNVCISKHLCSSIMVFESLYTFQTGVTQKIETVEKQNVVPNWRQRSDPPGNIASSPRKKSQLQNTGVCVFYYMNKKIYVENVLEESPRIE